MSAEQGKGERMEPASVKYKILCQVFCRSKKKGSEIVSYLHFAFKKALDHLFLKGCNEFLISFVLPGTLSHPLVGQTEGKCLCWSDHSVASLENTCHWIFLLWAALPTFPPICFPCPPPHGLSASKICCSAPPPRLTGAKRTPPSFLFALSNISPCGIE